MIKTGICNQSDSRKVAPATDCVGKVGKDEDKV